MNLFLDALPKTIVVAKKAYPIAWDFRTWAAVDKVFSDCRLAVEKKLSALLTLCFQGQVLPPDFKETIEALLRFYVCDGLFFSDGEEKRENTKAPILSVTYDAPYLYAAIFAQYGVDLTTDNPHWFAFCAMVKGLTEEHLISRIMWYRSVDLKQVKDHKERRRLAALKKRYRLPELRTEEQIGQDTAMELSRLFED